MKKLLIVFGITGLLCTVFLMKFSAYADSQKVRAWFIVPKVTLPFALPDGTLTKTMITQPYLGNLTITSWVRGYYSSTQSLIVVNAPQWQVNALSVTANCTFLTNDPASYPSVMQAIAAQKIIDAAQKWSICF